tara:strand:- start:4124 stop:4486 length:363 start_codon:yes stop_codon:yes gene_type:complete
MTKIVLNGCYGGFGLSDVAYIRYAEIAGLTLYPEKTEYGSTLYYLEPKESKYNRDSLYDGDMDRTDPALVQVVEELGEKSWGSCSKLYVVEIPKGTQYRIDEYDGLEHLETRDRINWSVA